MDTPWAHHQGHPQGSYHERDCSYHLKTVARSTAKSLDVKSPLFHRLKTEGDGGSGYNSKQYSVVIANQ